MAEQTMVERVAEAVKRHAGSPHFEDTARAAIEAMLEPTEEMVRAGVRAVGRTQGCYDDKMRGWYRAALNAALEGAAPLPHGQITEALEACESMMLYGFHYLPPEKRGPHPGHHAFDEPLRLVREALAALKP